MINRRSFIKRVGMLFGLAYANPIALIPEVPAVVAPVIVGNQFIAPAVVASEALTLLENELTFAYIQPAMKKLADKIDADIANQIMRRN